MKRRKKESVSSAARKPEASDKKVTIEAKAGNCTFEPPAWASVSFANSILPTWTLSVDVWMLNSFLLVQSRIVAVVRQVMV